MSIGWSMTTSLSGLNAFSRAIGHISDNISNTQTLGYKRVDTDFRSFLTTSTVRRHDPGGVVATPNFRHSQSGQITISQYDTAFAIDGQGFIPVKVPFERGGQLIFSDAEVPMAYTRAGDFRMDRNGYLVNSAGHYLMARNLLPGATGGAAAALVPAQFDPVRDGSSPARATTRIDFNANLPAGSTRAQTNDVQFFDPQGSLQTLSMAWTRQVAPPANNTWNLMFNAQRQVDRIQLNESGLAPGETLSFAIGNDRVTITAPSGGYTAAEARDALIAAINANAGLADTITATRGARSNELTITGNVPGQLFLSQISGNANPIVTTTQPGIPPMEVFAPENNIGTNAPRAEAGQTTRYSIPSDGLSPGNFYIFRVNGETFTVRNTNPVLDDPPVMMTAAQVRNALVQQINDNSSTVEAVSVGTREFQLTANSGSFSPAPSFTVSGPAPNIGFRPDDNSAPATDTLTAEGFRAQITDINLPASGLAGSANYSVELTRSGNPTQTFTVTAPAAGWTQAQLATAIRAQINADPNFVASNLGDGRVRITAAAAGTANSFTTVIAGNTIDPEQQALDQLKFVIDGPLTPGNAIRVTLTQGVNEYEYTVHNTNAPGGANLTRAQVLASLRDQILNTSGANFTVVVGDGELRVRSTQGFSGESEATTDVTATPTVVPATQRVGTATQVSTVTMEEVTRAVRAEATVDLSIMPPGFTASLDLPFGPATITAPGGGYTEIEARDAMIAAIEALLDGDGNQAYTATPNGPPDGRIRIQATTYGTAGNFTIADGGGDIDLTGDIVDAGTDGIDAGTSTISIQYVVDGVTQTDTYTYTGPNDPTGVAAPVTAAAAGAALSATINADRTTREAAGEEIPYTVSWDAGTQQFTFESTVAGSVGRLGIGATGTDAPTLEPYTTSMVANDLAAGQDATITLIINGTQETFTVDGPLTADDVALDFQAQINAYFLAEGLDTQGYNATIDGLDPENLIISYPDLGRTNTFYALAGGDVPPDAAVNDPTHAYDLQQDIITLSRSSLGSGETVSITIRDERLAIGDPGGLQTFEVEVPDDVPPWWTPDQIAEAMVIEINNFYTDGRITAFVDDAGAINLRAENVNPTNPVFSLSALSSSLGADFAPVHGPQRAAATAVPVEDLVTLDIDTDLAVGRSVTVSFANPSHPLFPQPPVGAVNGFYEVTVTNDDDFPWTPDELRERLIEAINADANVSALGTASLGTDPGTILMTGVSGGIDGGLYVSSVTSDQELGEGTPPTPVAQNTEIDFREQGFPQEIQAGDSYTVTLRIAGVDYVYTFTAEEGDTPESRTQALVNAINTGADQPGVTVVPLGATGVTASVDPGDPTRMILEGDPDGIPFVATVRGIMVQNSETILGGNGSSYVMQFRDILVGQTLTFSFGGETVSISGSDADPQVRTAAEVRNALMAAINEHPVLSEQFTALPGNSNAEILLAQPDRTGGIPEISATQNGVTIPVGQLASLDLQGLPIVDVQPQSQVIFGPDGRLVSPASGQFTITLDWTLIDPTRGVQTVIFDIGDGGANPTGTTQYAGDEIRIRSIDVDGNSAGEFERVSVNDDGFVVFHYTNGENRRAYEIPVATFANADALRRLSGSLFSETVESGVARLRSAGEQGAGSVIAGAVEQSNVDIGEEFTKMIIAQRSYSANARAFTTADEMLQEALQLKR